MIVLFFLKKWIFPKIGGSLKDISKIFTIMLILCSFLTILATIIIHFIQFSIISSFIHKDLHFSFLNNQYNTRMWKENANKWEKDLKSPIKKVFTYSRQNGLLLSHQQKLPIQLQMVNYDFMSFFFLPYKEGGWEEGIPTITISEEMAYQLNINLQDIVEFQYIQKNYFQQEPASLKFMVSGILKNIPGNDPYTAFTPLSFVQEIFYTQLFTGVFLDNIKDIPLWKQKINNETGLNINDLFSRHYNLLYSFQWERTLLYFVLVTILLISCIIIYISFTLVIKEYKQQWALLNVLGLRLKTLLLVFFLKTFFLVILSFLLGLLLAFLVFFLYLQYISLPFNLFITNIVQWGSILYLLLLTLIISFISFLIPIYKLYYQTAMEGLKYDA